MNITIYHGSKEIVKVPSINKGKPNNDYGKGFYCTQDIELAKEWAVDYKNDGFANKYEIELDGLRILNLDNYCALTWLTVLIENREFTIKSNVALQAKEYLNNNFSIDYRDYDIITGYRADDSYFDFARSFLNNTITLETLEKALKYGKLGKQIVLISNAAYSKIKYIGYEIADHNKYYLLKILRDDNARESYYNNKYSDGINGTFITDIMKKGLTQNDF